MSSDYEDLFKKLNDHSIKYFVIGAHAVMFYAEPRFTKDIDIWIPPVLNDPQDVYDALRSFGAPLREVVPEDFRDPQMIFQIGAAPVRIDILVDLPGVSAEKAWKNRKRTKYGKTMINIIGLKELIQIKKSANRPQDKWDISRLMDFQKKKKI